MKTPAYRLTPLALGDLATIADHIAGDSPTRAARLVESVLCKCAFLASNPGLGTLRAGSHPPLRMFPFGKYLIFHRPAPGSGSTVPGIEIVRVLHGARDLDAIFEAADDGAAKSKPLSTEEL